MHERHAGVEEATDEELEYAVGRWGRGEVFGHVVVGVLLARRAYRRRARPCWGPWERGGRRGRKQVLEHGVRVGGIGDRSWQAGANGD